MEPSIQMDGLSPAAAQSRPRSTLRRLSRISTILYSAAIFVCIYNIYAAFRHGYTMLLTDDHLPKHTDSIFIPFVYKFSAKHVPQVMCTIEGVQVEMPVDTGSTGLLIGAPILPSVDPEIGEPAHHFFTSSKILYVGRLVELPLSFEGEGGSYATAKVPILIVDKSWRCPWYSPGKDTFECPSGPHGEKAIERDTSHIMYMGIGFGRNHPGDGMPIAAPRVNPFLNIVAIDGLPLSKKPLKAGYVVTTKGIELGLTPDNTRGFLFDELRPGWGHANDSRDWSMAEMCFSINGEGRNCGDVLVDTGIAQMYIRADEGVSLPVVTIRNPNKDGYAKMVKRVKRGTRISVEFPTIEALNVSYSFVIGEGSASEPSYVVPGRAGYPPFINTGRNFLRGHSIAFDAIDGRFGYRAEQHSSFSLIYQVLWPHLRTVFRFLSTHFSASGIVPGSEGEWNKVWLASEMCMRADTDAVLSAFRRMLPMTHACSHVKCAKVKLLSS
ncbi:hypothetical protein FB567DRAFT_469962 [Paraphoma chrysanthemicola]|uniref:Uncharacterized protein n=1 Tax=Paraphoma chrysanthemicola TaxID=798071 RepID=A0A8K0R4Q4_9PLEO|nr:hypothetical protein FB567DRAFT_469962 [Paraphoma chrysanthemicola]